VETATKWAAHALVGAVIVNFLVAGAAAAQPLVETTQPPVSPPPSAPSNVPKGEGAKLLAGWLNSRGNSFVINSETQKALSAIKLEVGSKLQEGTGGFLVHFEVYEHPESGALELSRVNEMGFGASMAEVERAYFRHERLNLKPPSGVLLSDANSTLVWIVKKNGELVVMTQPFPGATLYRASREVPLGNPEATRPDAQAAAEAQRRGAESQAAQEEASRKVRLIEQGRERAQQSQDAVERAQRAQDAMERAQRAQALLEQTQSGRNTPTPLPGRLP
jgi:hypothetical protein